MYFYKFDHPMNFVSPQDEEISFDWTNCGSDVYRYQASGLRWRGNPSVAELNTEGFSSGKNRMEAGIPQTGDPQPGAFSLCSPGAGVLETNSTMPFGVSGSKWLIRFPLEDTDRFYGMGEKNNGFEKSGQRTKFWNTDVWAEFATEQINTGITDPMYVSIPYLLLKRNGAWFGLLVNNPYAVFMNTGAAQVIEGVQETETNEKEFFLGSSDGEPDIFIIAGESPKEVTEKLFRLTGTAPRPPLWSLGYQQSRWGYACDKDLLDINSKLNEHDIPCDGIWMDIDYMDGYRVFSVNEERFGNLDNTLETIAGDGRRVVPILDPGVKADPDYSICREGLGKKLFCTTEESQPYVGFVWPGASYFPDFAKEETRNWWADETKKLTARGFGAYWVDMNDPSTGSADVTDMRFNDGRDDHEAYHNQYALLMQQATWKGITEAHPEERPFLLSRSGSIGSNNYGAIWTGDNISNWHHLRKSVEMALNLSLSGMAFYGADVGGFGGDAEDKNYIAWFKALFLFPFFRNHCADGQKNQEPWMMGSDALELSRRFIKARYALLPYLYNLFVDQEENGSPVITPLLYHFDEYPDVDDQFMVGNFIMQAPLLSPGNSRNILIPVGRWFDVYQKLWIAGPIELEYIAGPEETPLFIREGAIIPIKRDGAAEGDLCEIDFLCFNGPEPGSNAQEAIYNYRYDEGNGFAYKKGGDGEVTLSVSSSGDKISLELETIRSGFKPLKPRIILVGTENKTVQVNDESLALNTVEIAFAGAILNAGITPAL